MRGTLRSYWKATYVEELTDPILEIITDKARTRPSDRTFVVTFLMGGAINRVAVEDTAYSERSANWMVSIDGNWEDESDDDKVISWVRGAWGPGARARNGVAVPELHRRLRRSSHRRESRVPSTRRTSSASKRSRGATTRTTSSA